MLFFGTIVISLLLALEIIAGSIAFKEGKYVLAGWYAFIGIFLVLSMVLKYVVEAI